MGYKVSIVVPVYNVEQYLRTCMDSMVNQTLEDIEIIVVNDGSPDQSLAILEEYEKRYNGKVKVFTTENRGVSHARNYGIEKAVGDYLMFVDSDDFIELDMCEKLYEKAISDHNDIVLCGRYNVFEKGSNLIRKPRKTMLISQDFKLSECKFELIKISPFPWDKLFKRSLFDDIRFPEGLRFEDLLVSFKVLCKALCIGVLDEPLYNYRRTTQGGFLNSFSEQTLDIVTVFRQLTDYYEEKNYMDTYYDELEYICIRHFLFRYAPLFDESNRGKLELKKRIINETQDFLDKQFPAWRQNSYLKYSSAAEIRSNLDLYTDRKKIMQKVTSEERTPLRIRKLKIKWKKFVSRKNKWKRLKSKIPLFKLSKLFHLPATYHYTKYLTKYQVSKKDILFFSKQGKDIAGNIFTMLQELKGSEFSSFTVSVILDKGSMAAYQELLNQYGLNFVHTVPMHTDEYYKALATARYLITDTSFPIYFVKRPEQVYLNTWHGTPLKAMGRLVPLREYALGNVQRNFYIADYLLYQNEFSKDIFLKDYMIENIYNGTVLLSGYPRNSSFFHTERYHEIRKELGVEEKQIIVYMPTWRGLMTKMETAKQVKEIYDYLARIDLKLHKNQLLYVKLHPFVRDGINYNDFVHIQNFPKKYETYDFLNASDMLITDYSSIMFDYAVSQKRMVLFTYDREEYLTGRGMYLDLNQVDIPLADTVSELIQEINRPLTGKCEYPEFFSEYCAYDSADSAKKVCETVFLEKEVGLKTWKKPNDGKKNVLLYVRNMRNSDRMNHLIEQLNEIDTTKYNFYLCFRAGSVKKSTKRIALLKKEIGYIPLQNSLNRTLPEALFFTLKYKCGMDYAAIDKKVDQVLQREIAKHFGNLSFDTIFYYSGADRMIFDMLGHMQGKKIYNFKNFSEKRYKEDKKYRKSICHLLKYMGNFNMVTADEECSILHLDNLTNAGVTVVTDEEISPDIMQVMQSVE